MLKYVAQKNWDRSVKLDSSSLLPFRHETVFVDNNVLRKGQTMVTFPGSVKLAAN